MREKWLKAIGLHLREIKTQINCKESNKFICNLHFTESDFTEGTTSFIVDGKEVTLPRQRMRLKAGTVPSLFNVSKL